MNPSPSEPFPFHKAILAAIEKEVENIVAQEAKEAGHRVEHRVRGLVGTIATRLAEQVSYDGSRLQIVVRIDKPV